MITKKQKLQAINDKIALLEPKTHPLFAVVPLGINNRGQGRTLDEMKEAAEAREQINQLEDEKHKILLEKSE